MKTHRGLRLAVPSWLLSMIAHAVALLLLAMISLSQPTANVIFLRGELATKVTLLPEMTEFSTVTLDTLEPNLQAPTSIASAEFAVLSDIAIDSPEVAWLLLIEPEITPKHWTQFSTSLLGLSTV